MKKKNVNIELLRVVSMMLVILTHVLNINYLDWDGSFRPKVCLLNTICITAVPCFFMITGYFSDAKQNPWRKIEKMITGVAIPTVIVGLMVQFLWPWLNNTMSIKNSIDSANLSRFFEEVVAWRIEKIPGCRVFWYSTTYVQLILMFPVLRLLCTDTKEARIGRISVFLLCIFKFFFVDVSQFVHFPVRMYSPYDRSVLFFLLGYEARLIRWEKVPAALLAAGLAVGCGLMYVLTVGILSKTGKFSDYFFHYLTVPCVIASVCMFALVITKLRLPSIPWLERAICFGGKASFYVYLTHFCFLTYLRNRAPFWDNHLIMLILLWVTTAALSFALAGIIRLLLDRLSCMLNRHRA